MSRKIPWLIDPYKGNDALKTYACEKEIVHGFFIKNFDKVNSLDFTLKGMIITLEPTQQSLLNFNTAIDTVIISNNSECEFMCGGIG